MAVQAGPGEHPVLARRRGAPEGFKIGVDRAGMPYGIVTALAELRGLLNEKL